MVEKKISVIVPIYNCVQYLKECIESIINQTYKNLEIILVDDGSEDGSSDICIYYSNIDKRIQYFKKANGGVSSARNFAIAKASGEYIAFVDADDCMTKDMLYEMYLLIESTCSDIVVVSFFCDRMSDTDKVVDKKIESFDGVEAVREMHIGNRFQGHLWNKLFKRQLFLDVTFNEEITINEDMLLVQTLFFKSQKVSFLDKPLYYYRMTSDSALRSKFKETDLSGRQACLLMREEIQDKCNELLIYVNKSIVYTDLFLLEKLYYSKMMDSNYFKMLQKEIASLDCKEIYEMLCNNNILKMVIYKSILIGKLSYVVVKKTEDYLRDIKRKIFRRNVR